MNKGFIKLYRKVQDHWLYSNNEYLACWIKILLNVNHSDNKVLIGGKLFDVKAGESLRALDKWSDIFGKEWDKSKTRRFFELLKSDHMIETQNERITTRLTVLNFATYNTTQNTDETQNGTDRKRKRNASETDATPNKNEEEGFKNEKNDKEIPTSDEVRSLFIGYLAILNITDYDIDRTDGQIRAFIRYYIGDEDSKGVWQTTRKKFNPKSCVKNWIDKNPNIYKPYKKAEPELPKYSTWMEAIYGEASKDPKIYPGKVENYMNWRDQSGFFDGWEYERIIKHAINQCKKDENRCKSEV